MSIREQLLKYGLILLLSSMAFVMLWREQSQTHQQKTWELQIEAAKVGGNIGGKQGPAGVRQQPGPGQ